MALNYWMFKIYDYNLKNCLIFNKYEKNKYFV